MWLDDCTCRLDETSSVATHRSTTWKHKWQLVCHCFTRRTMCRILNAICHARHHTSISNKSTMCSQSMTPNCSISQGMWHTAYLNRTQQASSFGCSMLQSTRNAWYVINKINCRHTFAITSTDAWWAAGASLSRVWWSKNVQPALDGILGL